MLKKTVQKLHISPVYLLNLFKSLLLQKWQESIQVLCSESKGACLFLERYGCLKTIDCILSKHREKRKKKKKPTGKCCFSFLRIVICKWHTNRSYITDSIIILKYQWIILQKQPIFCIYFSISESRICAAYTEHMHWKHIQPIQAFLSITP